MKFIGTLIALCLTLACQQFAFAQDHSSFLGRGGRFGGGHGGGQSQCELQMRDAKNYCVNSTESYSAETECFRQELQNQNGRCAPVGSHIVDRCSRLAKTWEQEAKCYRGRIEQGENYQWDVMKEFRCAYKNFYGSYAEGGGCNFYGCYRPGGGCNFYGCYQPGGSCGFNGCTNAEPGKTFTCTN